MSTKIVHIRSEFAVLQEISGNIRLIPQKQNKTHLSSNCVILINLISG